MKFHEEHKDLHDRYVILTFHDPQAKTVQDLEGHLARLKEQKWGGKDLPFPVLLDPSGKTLKAWGVNAFPTVVVLDPEGNLVFKDHFGVEEFLLEQIKSEKSAPKKK